MSFKKLLVVPLIIATLGLTVPAKKAEAGVVMTFSIAGLFNHEHKDIGYAIGGTVGSAMTVAGLIYAIPMYQLLPGFGLVIMGSAIVLDANGNLPKEAITTSLAEKYNFIDNQMVIENLAAEIKAKYETVKHINPEAYIALTEAETRAILEAANLSESETLQVVSDLK